jgi:AAA domain
MAEAKPARRRSSQELKFDLSHVRTREPVKQHAWKNGADPGVDAEPGSFAARVESKRVDLVALVKEGIPPRAYHAHSDGMFVKGKRHLIAAPAKTGKSIVCLAHWTRLALAGERIVVLDRENGADVYAERLAAIMDAWGLTKAKRSLVQKNLIYVDYPVLKREDAAELVRYLRDDLAADLVCFDSQRLFLTDYGFSERDTDDYSRFMGYCVDPLHRVGITTVLIDNVGHGDDKRARGTSSKGDLNEQLFSLRVPHEFDRSRRGTAQLVLERSRFGDRGSWRMAIGAGEFGEWESDAERSEKIVASIAQTKPALKPTVYEVLRAAEGPMGLHKLLGRVRAKEVKVGRSADAKRVLSEWVADPAEPLRHVEGGYVCDQ